MIITPRIRGYICTTAHPTGCAALVDEQIRRTRAQPPLTLGGHGPNVLILGGSGGYGLASRIVAGFGLGAKTISLSFEKEPTPDGTATSGWYNTRAFDRAAASAGLYARSVNADAFADSTKEEIAGIIGRDLGGIDLLVYSLASPVRRDPDSGVLYRSVIKPLGHSVTIKTLNVDKGVVHDVELQPATDDEARATTKVMGGEDWERWISHLLRRGLLRHGFRSVAYTYLGSDLTWPIYWDGTLGKAKEDVDAAASRVRSALAPLSGDARVAALKAVVTQASSAIPAIPLYASILFRVMKDQAVHEDCLQHIDRLFRTVLAADARPQTDAAGRWRIDDWELRADIQAEVRRRWDIANTENILDISDLEGFRRDFLRIFGFAADGVDYSADVSPID